MLVNELFPKLANQIFRDLLKLKRNDLAEQVMSLRIIDRCRCGAEACGTFYTEDAEPRRRRRGADLTLHCGASVTEAGGKIVRIETLDPQVEEVLRRVIP
jgi:hypothetical protein